MKAELKKNGNVKIKFNINDLKEFIRLVLYVIF